MWHWRCRVYISPFWCCFFIGLRWLRFGELLCVRIFNQNRIIHKIYWGKINYLVATTGHIRHRKSSLTLIFFNIRWIGAVDARYFAFGRRKSTEMRGTRALYWNTMRFCHVIIDTVPYIRCLRVWWFIYLFTNFRISHYARNTYGDCWSPGHIIFAIYRDIRATCN